MAKALDANIRPVRGPRAEPDGASPTFRFPHELLTFRFVELLTRTPTPRPLRSSSWGYGFFADPSHGRSGDCTVPKAPGVANPHAASPRWVRASAVPATAPSPRPWRRQSSRCKSPLGPSLGSSGDCAIPTTPGVANPHAASSRWGRALADPATAPCPQPLAFPIFVLSIPVGSEP